MKTILTGLLSAGLLFALTGTGSAHTDGENSRRHYSRYYNSPTLQRQWQNERAYKRGEYYERDSNALRPGSRAWFEQKEREGGDRR